VLIFNENLTDSLYTPSGGSIYIRAAGDESEARHRGKNERTERHGKLHNLPVVLHCFVFKYFFHHRKVQG
jgi:hypothetical protein